MSELESSRVCQVCRGRYRKKQESSKQFARSKYCSPACYHESRVKHGHAIENSAIYNTKSAEYHAWQDMKRRCFNPSYRSWHRYGGRGITVCALWTKSFPAFLYDVGPKPEPHLTLERINNDGNYEPGNVKWATWMEQAHNRS